MRTALLADKLVERGHKVLWWSSAFDHYKKDWIYREDKEVTLPNGVTMNLLKGIGYKRNISLSRFIDHRIVAKKIRKFAPSKSKPDVMVVSMPPHDAAYSAIKYAKTNGIPVIVDIRDPWPDIFLNHVPGILKPALKNLLHKDFDMNRFVMKEADSLVAVSNTFLEWGLKYAQRERLSYDQVFYLGAKRSSSIKDSSNRIDDLLVRLNNKFVVVFIGTFAHYHNPKIVVDCASKIGDEHVHFVLAGKGEFYNSVNKEAKNLRNVTLTGWLNQPEINSLLQRAQVGVCPTTQEIDLFPNKAFSYLSAGLPLISAFQGDLKEIIEKRDIGLYYPPNDVDSFVNCVRTMHDNVSIYATMAKNVKEVFGEMFDADKIYEQYSEHIERVCRGFSTR